MADNNFIMNLQAMLDKVKSLANIKKDIKSIEPKLKIKLQGTLDKTATKKEVNTSLKTIKPKIKIDADTSKAVQKIKQIGKQKTTTTIQPTVDNSQVISSLKETQKETKSLFDRFLNGVVGVNLVRISVQKVTQAIHQAITGLKELDAIKTNIQMVSGSSDSGVDAMMRSYNTMAKELSSTTKEVTEAANEFLRMGESVASTNELIKSSQVLSKVGMIQSSEAASYLISSLKGYQVAAEDSMNIVSKLTSVDLKAAVSAGGLAEALSKCSNIANNSGVAMDRLIGYTATVGETTQKSMSEVGNSFQALLSRMNNIKIGRFIDDETGESLSDTEAVLNKLGIQLRDTEDSYRSFDDVLDDVGSRWKDFTKVEQNAISVAIAGTRQRENFESLMNNYANALKYSETAANSAGSALERYGVYQDSIEAKTNELTAAIESLSTNTISEDLFAGIIGATTNVVEFVDKMGILKGTLAGLVAMGISKTFVSMATGIVSAAKSTSQLTTAMALFDKGKSITNLQRIGHACKGLSDQQLKLVLSTKGLEHEDRLWILTGKGVAESEREQTLATLGFASAENTATASTFSFKGAMDALKIAIASNPIGAAITAITTVVTVGTMVFSGFNQALDDIRQNAEELGDAFNSTKSEIEDYKTKIEELYTVINNSGSSIEDVTEARKNLMSIQDELIEKFGTEKGAIDAITASINGQTEAFDELTQRQWQEMKNEFNDKGLVNDIINFASGYKNNIDRMLDEFENYTVTIDLSKYGGKLFTEGYDDFKQTLINDFGAEISGAGSEYLELAGNASEVHQKLLEIQTLVNESGNFKPKDSFDTYLGKLSNAAEEMSNKYKEMYDNYVLYEEIFKNNDYKDSFRNITEAYGEYREADISGDEEAIAKATENYASVITSAMEQALENGDTDVVGYFESMYPELQSVIEQWKFKTKILPDFDTGVLKGKTENEVLEMLQTEGTQDGEGVFNSLLEKAAEYGVVTGENSEKVQQLLDLLVDLEILQREVSEDAQDMPTSFQDAFDSLDTDVQQKLLDLAKSGEITPSVLESTEEYAELLTKTETSAESAKNQILDMLSAQEKLAGAANGLKKLESSYEEFKDIGFVTAQSLESLPDAFKELEGYDLFSKIVGDPTQGKEKIQQAFNDIVKEYIISQDTLSGLVNASEAEIQSYIANLKEMGITNAEEVINTAIQVMNQENELINAAEKEYMNYLNAKEGYDEEYLKGVTSKNGQLLSALGKTYKSDYDNWCNLMKQKAEVYNKFINSIKNSINYSSGSPLSTTGWADKVLKDTANGTKNTYNDSLNPYAKPQQPKQGYYTQNQVKLAREIKQKDAETEKLKQQLSIAISTIDTDYSTNYSPKGSGGNSGSDKDKNSKEETQKEFSEIFDWIERRIKKFQSKFDKWIKQAETAVTRDFVNKYYKKAISSAKNLLSAYGKSYNKYMKKANAVDLDEKYAKKVRNGTMDIEEIYAKGTEEDIKKYEELADKIKKYQDYYDKAQESMDSFMETAEKLYNLPLDKAARKVDIFNDSIDLLGKRIDNATNYITKNKLIDKQDTKEKNILKSYNTAKTDTQKALNSARKALRKNKNLNKDDGITAKERKRIKTATKSKNPSKNKEVNLSLFKENSAGYKAAVKYNEALKAYKKAVNDAKIAKQDYQKWEVESAKLKFDNIADHYNKEIQKLDFKMSALDNKISEIEASGRKVDKSFYEDQKKVNQDMLAQYQAEKKALEDNIKNIKQGTDEWYDAYDQIQQVASAISDCTKKTYELNNAINQINFDLADDISKRIGRIITEQEFLQGLFAHEKNVDSKTGNFTDAGLAKLGSLSASYYAAKSNTENDQAVLKELLEVKDKGKQADGSYVFGRWKFNSLDDLQAKIDEFYTKTQEDIKQEYDLKTKIYDLQKEQYQAELDFLKDLIDAKKDALNALKDLHDYNRTINEKTSDINTLRKQIAAYSGDTSEEGRAKLQKLQKELSDKEDDLKETEYDRYISDQQNMLDKLYEEYSDKLEEKLENFMVIVQDGLDIANDNMVAIGNYLKFIAAKNGYDPETNGLYDGSSGDIETNVENTTGGIIDDETRRSQETAPVPATTPAQKLIEPPIETSREIKTDYKKIAQNYIKNHVNKTSKNKSELSDINKVIYENKGKKLYNGSKKILTTKELEELARRIFAGNYSDKSKKGNLYNKLKSLKVPGFKKGGVVSVDDIEKQVHENGDTSLVSVNNGEGFVEREHVKPVKELVESVPEINKLTKVLSDTPIPLTDISPKTDNVIKTADGVELVPVQPDLFKNISADAIKNLTPDFSSIIKHNLPDFQPVSANNTTNIDIGGITMNGVNDPEEFSRQIAHAIKTKQIVQNSIHAVETNRLVGIGNALSVNSIR